MEKYIIQVNLAMPNFFLGVDSIVFPAFIFSNFKPPASSQGLCCFSEHWADSDLHCNYCAPHMGTLPKQEDDKVLQNNSKEQCV